jgi:hypothetical protein
MLLPMPNPDHVLRYQELYERLTGNPISLKNAQADLIGLVQFYYLLDLHKTSHARRMRQRAMKRGKAFAHPDTSHITAGN